MTNIGLSSDYLEKLVFPDGEAIPSITDEHIINLHLEWMLSFEIDRYTQDVFCFVALNNYSYLVIIGTIKCSKNFELNFSNQ